MHPKKSTTIITKSSQNRHNQITPPPTKKHQPQSSQNHKVIIKKQQTYITKLFSPSAGSAIGHRHRGPRPLPPPPSVVATPSIRGRHHVIHLWPPPTPSIRGRRQRHRRRHRRRHHRRRREKRDGGGSHRCPGSGESESGEDTPPSLGPTPPPLGPRPSLPPARSVREGGRERRERRLRHHHSLLQPGLGAREEERHLRRLRWPPPPSLPSCGLIQERGERKGRGEPPSRRRLPWQPLPPSPHPVGWRAAVAGCGKAASGGETGRRRERREITEAENSREGDKAEDATAPATWQGQGRCTSRSSPPVPTPLPLPPPDEAEVVACRGEAVASPAARRGHCLSLMQRPRLSCFSTRLMFLLASRGYHRNCCRSHCVARVWM
ncbi:hypothetical protein DAI22_10g062900 [Oryza sativa Japonica Group]|nr:hypothetical protein DAI22_10g062900 [Oryza sativa Japonica Group]